MHDLKVLREQIASDFQTTWKVMGDTADRIDAGIEELRRGLEELRSGLGRLGGETAEGLRQAQGRMRLLEQRFGVFLEAVEAEVEGRALRSDLEDLKARVERLERDRPPAA